MWGVVSGVCLVLVHKACCTTESLMNKQCTGVPLHTAQQIIA